MNINVLNKSGTINFVLKTPVAALSFIQKSGFLGSSKGCPVNILDDFPFKVKMSA